MSDCQRSDGQQVSGVVIRCGGVMALGVKGLNRAEGAAAAAVAPPLQLCSDVAAPLQPCLLRQRVPSHRPSASESTL